MLRFSRGKNNVKLAKLEAKVKGKVYSFSLLSGHSCPFASKCLAKVVNKGGRSKVVDGPNQEFRCYSASEEALYPNLYRQRRHNLNQIKRLLKQVNNVDAIVSTIERDLPVDAKIVRIHVAGDFLTQAYFDAWVQVASNNPSVVFYAYTKSLPYWVRRLGSIPKNMRLTASYGGRHDDLIVKHGLKSAKVVQTVQDAKLLKLAVDNDDTHAFHNRESFALQIHGIQPKKA